MLPQGWVIIQNDYSIGRLHMEHAIKAVGKNDASSCFFITIRSPDKNQIIVATPYSGADGFANPGRRDHLR